MTFGTFDHLHAGHEAYLKQAKALGKTLITVVARDKTVKSVKGRFPDNNEKQRIKKLKFLNIADKIILGSKNNKYEIVLRFKPDIIALGYDQFTFTFQLEKFLIDHRINAKIVRMNPYRPLIYKSSIIRRNILAHAI